MVSFFAAAVVVGTALLFATLGEILMEKVGNLNLGIEGLMLLGALAGFATATITNNAILAIIASMIAGVVGCLIYALLTITLRANQVVSGLTLTIFGTGVANFAGKSFAGTSVSVTIKNFFANINIPILSEIPIIGEIFFKQNIFVYLGYFTAIILTLYLWKTRFGLHVRIIGENPSAADAAGINVILYKYTHTLMGGALCGLSGSYLALVYVPSWQENITSGLGWIAVALVIFASWNPIKAVYSSYLFGGLKIIGFRLQNTQFAVSQYFMDMLPYIVTILVLVVISNRKHSAQAPKSLGTAYFREER